MVARLPMTTGDIGGEKAARVTGESAARRIKASFSAVTVETARCRAFQASPTRSQRCEKDRPGGAKSSSLMLQLTEIEIPNGSEMSPEMSGGAQWTATATAPPASGSN